MADAVYIHSSLHFFDAIARQAVIKELFNRIDDVTVKCWYDTGEDVFCLTCPPGDIGPAADSALARIIQIYTGEAGHAGVTRFSESDVDQLDVATEVNRFTEPCADVAVQTNPQASVSNGSSATLRAALAYPSKVYYLLVTRSQTSQVKFFTLRQLPVGHLERTLSSQNSTVRNAVSAGLTARVVRWNAASEQYVFNGRTGAPIQQREASEVFEKTTFTPLRDSRPNVPTMREQQNPQTENEWRVRGQKPTMQDFLAGIGETEYADPSQVQEMPEDTKKLMASNGPITTVGRARVPKARAGSVSSEDGSDPIANYRDENESSSALQAQAFSSLLGGSNSKAEAVPDFGYDSGDEEAEDGAMDFAALLSRPSKEAQVSTPSDAGSLKPHPHGMDSIAITSQAKTPVITPPLSTNAEQSINTESSLPMYPKKYAAVDRHGLMSVASLQAEWETENMSPRRHKPSKSGIASRRIVEAHSVMSPPPTEDGSTIALRYSTSSSPQRVQMSHSSRSASQHTSSSGGHAYSQPWATRTPPRYLPQGLLVDVSTSSTTTANPLPGFDMVQESSLPPYHAPNGSKTNQTTTKPMQNLIDFDDDADNDKPIVERLAPPMSDPVKIYTMRQQKGKKKAGGSQKSTPKNNKSGVSLPKPDPLPIAKKLSPTKQQIPQINKAPVLTDIKIRSEHRMAKAPTAMEPVAKASTKIGSFLLQLDSVININGSKVVVQFGTILTTHKDNEDFFRNAFDVAKMEANLQAASDMLQTEVLTRLTTSLTDVHAIFDAFPGTEITGVIEYEMHVKDSRGSNYIIRFDKQHASDSCIISPASNTIATVYFQYPMHIYDARLTIENDAISDDNANALLPPALQLIDTLTTIDSAPSFQGLAPKHAFTIDKIYAKRIFTKTGTHGIKMVVTEIYDLFIQPIIDPEYYNFSAIALEKEDMVREQRFWYEACLTMERGPLSAWDKLQDVVDGVVSAIDGVGFGNQGPWVRVERAEGKKKSEGSVEWYW